MGEVFLIIGGFFFWLCFRVFGERGFCVDLVRLGFEVLVCLDAWLECC